jgi:hypothetical protein
MLVETVQERRDGESKRQRQRYEEEDRCALRPVPDNRAKPRCSVLIEASVANIDKLPLVESKICLVFAEPGKVGSCVQSYMLSSCRC